MVVFVRPSLGPLLQRKSNATFMQQVDVVAITVHFGYYIINFVLSFFGNQSCMFCATWPLLSMEQPLRCCSPAVPPASTSSAVSLWPAASAQHQPQTCTRPHKHSTRTSDRPTSRRTVRRRDKQNDSGCGSQGVVSSPHTHIFRQHHAQDPRAHSIAHSGRKCHRAGRQGSPLVCTCISQNPSLQFVRAP